MYAKWHCATATVVSNIACILCIFVLISCTMLLLQQKADISVNICIVPDPPKDDDEEESKVVAKKKARSRHSSESSDMEDDSDDASEHSGSDESSDEAAAKAEKKKKKKKPAWIWQPMKVTEKSKQIESYSVFQV